MRPVHAETHSLSRADALAGCLLGTAVGDALGLPYEGLSPRRASRLYGPPDRMRLVFGRGMISDDTEHACLVAQALIGSATEEDAFLHDLARRLRWWLAGIPAGIGLATLRSCLKLWCGVSPRRSGVFSAGNGPAMRATILGAAIDDVVKLKTLVQASSRLTHTDPQAEHGALTIALAARTARHTSGPNGFLDVFLDTVAPYLDVETAQPLLERLTLAVESVRRNEPTQRFAEQLGLSRGVTGYINHTVPAAVHAWLSHPTDLHSALTEIITCGGDADSTAALVGGLVGTAVGPAGIPKEWLDRLLEQPRSVAWMTQLAAVLDDVVETNHPTKPPELAVLPLLARNALFAAVVLSHGVYRLRPW
jgi:ADP-ribosyl-[dinitrogen reductase] hydrolase